ncbi:MAG: hypothetical protein HFG07_08425 [Oscillibacter sp.]|nr:hypothetical protein [Oscillibacter sp.]
MFDHCPRCGEALTLGFVRSGQRCILWTSSGKRRISYLPMREGEFSLPGESLWSGVKCPSQYCENCGLILIETKEEEST